VDALDAAGLGLCHSDYSDLPQYDIYGILGALSTKRYFPHHSAVPIHTDNTDAVSCVTPSQPGSGTVEIDAYPSHDVAAAVLRQVGQVWLGTWLYGNIAIVVDQAPPPEAQEVRQVLEHLPGAFPFRP
jgi:hypothetical protein